MSLGFVFEVISNSSLLRLDRPRLRALFSEGMRYVLDFIRANRWALDRSQLPSPSAI
jgi:hypothetical protein